MPSSQGQAVKVIPLVQLSAGRAVHGVVTSREALIYCVETADGQDVAVALPASGIPRATSLSAANILAALGETVGGGGTIQSLAITSNDVIWFYFLGGKGKRLHACLGQFSAVEETIRIVADTPTLQRVSGMGDALGLVRGTLLGGGDAPPRLLLRNPDQWILLEARPGEPAPLRAGLSAATQDGQPFPLNQERYEPAAGPSDTTLLLDRGGAALWSMDRGGEVKLSLPLVGLPRELSLPRLRDGKLTLFAADSELVEGDAFDTLHRKPPTTAWPALLNIDARGVLSAIGRDDFQAGRMNLSNLRLHELVPTPSNDWVAYDAASGQIVKLSYVEK